MDEIDDLPRLVRAAYQEFLTRIEPHRADLWKYCYRLTGSPWDAEDLVQESLMRALAQLSLVWQPANPRAYLFRVASNTWIDHMRRGEAATANLDEHEIVARTQPDSADSLAALDYLASTLPRRQAVIVLLVDVFDFRLNEVAEMIGSTETAAKGALQRARATLRSRATAAPEVHTSAARTSPDAFTAEYIAAFNRRDPDAIAALLSEDCVVDIVGVGENRGRAFAREDALRQWAADPLPQRAEAGVFAGASVVFVFAPDSGGMEQLHRIDQLLVQDAHVLSLRTYFYTPELLALAGAALGIPAARHPRICDDG